MSKLTEEMVIARTRASDLSNIKKLNCWGSDLTDVSLLRNLKNVEVLSLSVNNITTLLDFQYCHNLQELYVRKNNIKDLDEICYLRDLPKLRSLWLADNPCAEGDMYRLTVIRNLPQLQKLDNIAVKAEEHQEAQQHGIQLIHPRERKAWEDLERERERDHTFFTHQSSLPERRGSQGSGESPPRGPGHMTRSESDYSVEQMNRLRIREEENEHYDPDWRNANYVIHDDAETRYHLHPHYNSHPMVYSKPSSVFSSPTTEYPADHYMPARGPVYQGSDYPSHCGPGSGEQDSAPCANASEGAATCQDSSSEDNLPQGGGVQAPSAAANFRPPADNSQAARHGREGAPHAGNDVESGRYSVKSGGSEGSQGQCADSEDARHVVSQHYEKAYHQVQQQIDAATRIQASDKSTHTRPYPTRPKTRLGKEEPGKKK